MITGVISEVLDRVGGPGSSSKIKDPIKQLEVVNNAKILLAFLNESVFVVDMIFKMQTRYSKDLKSEHSNV